MTPPANLWTFAYSHSADVQGFRQSAPVWTFAHIDEGGAYSTDAPEATRMSTPQPPELDALLAEQQRYYRARADRYLDEALVPLGSAEATAVREALDALFDAHFRGDVLELACGPGTWTAQLASRATSVTAVDGAPEMLDIARRSAPDPHVRLEQADIFSWEPDRRYDAVFFGFWLSHVPPDRFDAFWAMVDRALAPGGTVVFIDDAYRSSEELIYGADSPFIVRDRDAGSEGYRIVKVPHTPEGLKERLAASGWSFEMTNADPFFWGRGTRAA